MRVQGREGAVDRQRARTEELTKRGGIIGRCPSHGAESFPMTTLLDSPVYTEILDQTHEDILEGDTHAAMGRLRLSLREWRSRLPAADWAAVGQQARRHPIHEVLLESPFTRRAYQKPRGYAGDAGLMDLIYGLAPATELSPLGGMLYGYEFDSPCFQSVRTRRA